MASNLKMSKLRRALAPSRCLTRKHRWTRQVCKSSGTLLITCVPGLGGLSRDFSQQLQLQIKFCAIPRKVTRAIAEGDTIGREVEDNAKASPWHRRVA